jgi:RNA polymerase sigma factor for flagellar operon FliA
MGEDELLLEQAQADAEREAALWLRWRRDGDRAARDVLVEQYTLFAHIMAKKLYRGRYGEELQFADYLQFATLGMMEAFEHYDPDKGASFRTYSALRIRGAVLDGVCSMSERQQQIASWRRLQQDRSESLAAGKPARHGSFADLAEIAIGLALGYMLDGSTMYQDGDESAGDTPYSRLELRQLQQQLHALIERLPASERYVVKAHYLHRTAFVDIAVARKITKVRVSQLHQQALGRLRKALAAVAPCDMAW